MKLTEISDYRNKKLRRSTWVPKAYMVFKDGQWWSNSFWCETMKYEFAPMKESLEDESYEDWEEYVEWKGEVLEELHHLRLAIEQKNREMETLITRFRLKIESINCTKESHDS
jgi:hypothetical protein